MATTILLSFKLVKAISGPAVHKTRRLEYFHTPKMHRLRGFRADL